MIFFQVIKTETSKNFFKKRSKCRQVKAKNASQEWQHTPLIPALGRQPTGQHGLKLSFRLARDTEKPCLKKDKFKNK